MRVNVAASNIETPYEGAAWSTVESGDFNRISVLECEKFIHLAAALWKKRKPL